MARRQGSGVPVSSARSSSRRISAGSWSSGASTPSTRPIRCRAPRHSTRRGSPARAGFRGGPADGRSGTSAEATSGCSRSGSIAPVRMQFQVGQHPGRRVGQHRQSGGPAAPGACAIRSPDDPPPSGPSTSSRTSHCRTPSRTATAPGPGLAPGPVPAPGRCQGWAGAEPCVLGLSRFRDRSPDRSRPASSAGTRSPTGGDAGAGARAWPVPTPTPAPVDRPSAASSSGPRPPSGPRRSGVPAAGVPGGPGPAPDGRRRAAGLRRSELAVHRFCVRPTGGGAGRGGSGGWGAGARRGGRPCPRGIRPTA